MKANFQDVAYISSFNVIGISQGNTIPLISNPSTLPLSRACPRMILMSTAKKVLKPKWKCMQQCGACCYIGDYDEEVIRKMLKTEEDVFQYLNMIHASGWCKWFDTSSRTCTIYENRPKFCRATPDVFHELYNIPELEFDETAISFCEHHIENFYGSLSHEASRYERFKAKLYSHDQQHEDQ